MTQPVLLSSLFPAMGRRPEIPDFGSSSGEIITTHPRLEVPAGNPLRSIFSNSQLASFFYTQQLLHQEKSHSNFPLEETIFSQYGLSSFDVTKMRLFFSNPLNINELDRLAEGNPLHVKKDAQNGLPRSLVYLPTQDGRLAKVFVLLKANGVDPLGQGGFKRATRAVSFFVNKTGSLAGPVQEKAFLSGPASDAKLEIEIMKLLQNQPHCLADGIAVKYTGNLHRTPKPPQFNVPKVGILIDLMEHGDLNNFCKQVPLEHWGRIDYSALRARLNICLDAAMGLQEMHHNKLVHNDVKPANVVVGAGRSGKMTDFGLAGPFGKKPEHMTMFQPPEVITNPMQRANYTPKADVFQFGLLLMSVLGYEKYTAEYKGTARSLIDTEARDYFSGYAQDIFDRFEAENSGPFVRLILDCVELNPERRITSDDLVARLHRLSGSDVPLRSMQQKTLTTPQEREQDFAESVARIEENFAKLKTLYAQVIEEAPVTTAFYDPSLCKVNLDILQPAPASQYVNLNLLDQCSLPWQVTQSGASDAMSLQTSMEIPSQELDALQALPLETPPDSLALPTLDVEQMPREQMQWPESVAAPKLKAPSFGELAKITHLELGEGIGGGSGLVCTLASGAKVSLSTTGDAILTGMSVPLSKGFGTAVQTGLPYCASAAALLICIHQLLGKREISERRARHQIKKDAQKTESDMQNVNNTLEDFDLFLESFARGEIDKKAFADRVNQMSEDLQRSARKIGERGKFAEDHRTQAPEGGLKHFFAKTSLRKLDLDLKTLTQEMFVQREVRDHFAPQLREKPLQALVKDLLALSSRRVLSLQQKYEQSALVVEISNRAKSENLDVLQHLDSLATHPVAISLNPAGVVKPEYLKSRYFNFREHSQERKRDRVKDWANNLQQAYQMFQEAAKAGDIGAIERTARDVFTQIDRTDGHHDVHLRDYDLKYFKHGPKENTAYEYYESFINSIASNTKDTLTKAREAQNAGVSEVNPAYFTTKEIQDFKIQSANNAYNQALASFNSETATEGEKDVAFSQMVKASEILKSQNVSDPQIQTVLTIGADYSSYKEYQEAMVRQNSIESGLKRLMETTRLYDEATSREEQDRLFALAFDETTHLLGLEIAEADIRKIASNEADASKILAQVHSIQKQYPQYKIDTARLKGLKSSLEMLQATTTKMEAENIKPNEYKRLYGEAFEIAKKVLKDGLSEADIRQFISKEEDPNTYLNWVQSIHAGYPTFARIDAYQSRTLPLVATPASRFALTVLNDSLRFDRPRINAGIQAFSSLHSLMPNLLPAAMNYVIARGYGETAAVVHGLGQHCLSAVKSNAISTLKKELRHPKTFSHKPFVKQAPAFLAANAVMQIATKALAAYTYRYWKDSIAADNLNQKAQNLALFMSGMSSAAQSTHTLAKTYKYISTATLGLKAHKVGQGLVGMGMSGFDIFEFLATNPAEFGLSQEFVTSVQNHLPTFHGNLPENTHYYMGKDALFTLSLASYSLQAPLLLGAAVVQGASSLFHYYRGRYKDDVLAAAMINLRYFSKLPDSEQKIASIKASYKNLMAHLDDDFVMDRSESKIRQKAKQLAFEYRLTCLEEEENWDEILAQTKIVDEMTDAKTICKWMPANIDISESIGPLLKHFNAAINKMSTDDRFGAMEIDKFLIELEHTSEYLNRYFEQLSTKEKERSSTYIECVKENLGSKKVQLLTNYCVYYVKGQLRDSPLKALAKFDTIPEKQRTLVHWYALGVISHNLFQESSAKRLQDLQLFCFERILRDIEDKEARNCALSPFEVNLKQVSHTLLQDLRGKLRGEPNEWVGVTDFTPIVQDILAKKEQRALCA